MLPPSFLLSVWGSNLKRKELNFLVLSGFHKGYDEMILVGWEGLWEHEIFLRLSFLYWLKLCVLFLLSFLLGLSVETSCLEFTFLPSPPSLCPSFPPSLLLSSLPPLLLLLPSFLSSFLPPFLPSRLPPSHPECYLVFFYWTLSYVSITKT